VVVTVCLAARFDGGVLCCTDTAVTYGENRFHTPSIKGTHRWDGFVMYAGQPWAAHEVVWDTTDRNTHEVVLAATSKYKDHENQHPDFPAEFLHIGSLGSIHILDEGSHFGPYQYACVGAGSSTAWPCLDILYKRIRNRTMSNTKKMLAETMRMCEKYDTSVYRPFMFEVVRD
jgi:hypothetical protein